MAKNAFFKIGKLVNIKPALLLLLFVFSNGLYPFSYVTPVTTLSSGETAYMNQRLSYVQNALQKRVSGDVGGHVPKIAVCISGGGLRAMVGGLGFMQAMEENGLLDITSYICGLSGSTWAISGWLQSGKSVSDYLEFIKPGLNKGLLGDINTAPIINELVKKFRNYQSISLDDIWGNLIAQKVLWYSAPSDLEQITVCNYVTLPDDGSLPLPIYNCVTPLEASDNQCYRWVEWTPYDVRCPFLQTAIPLASLGAGFCNGKALFVPEPLSLSFGQGVWGSAISVDFQDLLGGLADEVSGYEQTVLDFIQEHLETDVILNDITSVRALPARLPNWNYKLDGATAFCQETLTFVDCGMLCNLPLPPALDPLRQVDIIIVVDLTLETDNASELACMQTYAKNNKLPFPAIDTTVVGNICSVHPGDSSLGIPTIMYFPMVPNPTYHNGWNPLNVDFTSTLNLQYTPEQVDLVCGLMYTACQQNISAILDVIGMSI